MAQIQGILGNNVSSYLSIYRTTSLALGVDDSDSGKIKLKVSSTVGALPSGTAQFTIDPSANGNITLTPNGSGFVQASYMIAGAVVTDSSGQMSTAQPGTVGNVLTSNGAGTPPSFQASTGLTVVHTDSGDATPSAGAITIAGAGTVSTSGSGSTITITGSGGSGVPWTDVTGATVNLAVNNGYTLNRASSVTATLPATAAYGSIIEVVAINTGLGSIAQNAGQTIWFSTASHTTTGATGSLTFTTQYGSIKLLCTTADTDFTVLRSSGSFTIA